MRADLGFPTSRVNFYQKIQEQGSYSDWKTWENGKVFSSQGKVKEF